MSVSRRWKWGAWDWNAGAVWSFAHPAILTLWLLPVTQGWSPSPSPFPPHYFVYVVIVVIARWRSSSHTHTPSPLHTPPPLSLPPHLCYSETVLASLWWLDLDSRTWHSLTDCSLTTYRPDITCSVRHPCEVCVCVYSMLCILLVSVLVTKGELM